MPAWAPGSWAADAWAGTAWDESTPTLGNAWFETAWAEGAWGSAAWAAGGEIPASIGTVTPGETSVQFTYTGTPTHYRVFLLAGTPGSWVSIGSSPVTATGLTAGTEYTIQISEDGSTVADAENFGTDNPGEGGEEIDPTPPPVEATVNVGGSGYIGGIGSAAVSALPTVGVTAGGSGYIGGIGSASVVVADITIAPTITLHPVSQTVSEGGTVTFTAAADGVPTPTGQWQRDAAGAGIWSAISGATSSSYTTPAVTFAGGPASSGDRYRYVASNVAGSAQSEAATLTVSMLSSIAPDASALLASKAARRRTLRATSERLVNYMLKRSEAGPEKNILFREQVPGLTHLMSLDGPIRGAFWTGKRLFVVAGAKLYEVASNWSATELGSLNTGLGRVDMARGLLSLVIVDGPFGYVLTLADNSFAQITDPDFRGSRRVAFLDGRFIFASPDTQVFYWSAGIDTASDYNALDFASAESAPDDVVGLLVDRREIWLGGELGIEVWFPAPSEDQIYRRNDGAAIEVGWASAHAAQQIDNTIYFLGKDKRGQGIVWAIGGQSAYQPLRISSNELEEQLAKLTDLAGAWAWTYQDAGQTFYVLQVPGLESTWVYDASVQKWHERAEWVSGQFQRWRAETHAFAFGRHIVGDSTGKLYELDPYEYTNAGDVLYRLWVSPHNSVPSRQRVFFSRLRLDLTTGETRSGLSPSVEMSYSNDGGYTWSDWSARSSGELGQWAKPVKWDRLGMGRDRVWRFRCTEDAKVSIVGMHVDATEGTS